jgi:hypothetical protein
MIERGDRSMESSANMHQRYKYISRPSKLGIAIVVKTKTFDIKFTL